MKGLTHRSGFGRASAGHGQFGGSPKEEEMKDVQSWKRAGELETPGQRGQRCRTSLGSPTRGDGEEHS